MILISAKGPKRAAANGAYVAYLFDWSMGRAGYIGLIDCDINRTISLL